VVGTAGARAQGGDHPVHIYSSGRGGVCQAPGGLDASEEHEAVQARDLPPQQRREVQSGRWCEHRRLLSFAKGVR
jgi:hypothetical protein